MARTQDRAPSPYWDQSYVEIATQFAHLWEQIGVTSEVDLMASSNQKAQAVSRGTEGRPKSRMPSQRGFHHHVTDHCLLSWRHFLHVAHTLGAQEGGSTSGGNNAGITLQTSQRWRVEMIPVRMGNQDGINLWENWPWRRYMAYQRPHTAPQHRVGHYSDPIHLDEHCGVPHVRYRGDRLHRTRATPADAHRRGKPWGICRVSQEDRQRAEPGQRRVPSQSCRVWNHLLLPVGPPTPSTHDAKPPRQ